MAIDKNDEKRLIELVERIEGRKAHSFAAPSYKDSSDLNEIFEIIKPYVERLLLTKKYSQVEYSEAGEIAYPLRYLAESYLKMGRVAYSVKKYNQLIGIDAIAIVDGGKTDTFENDLYEAVRSRNYYHNDSCAEYIAISALIIGENKSQEIIEKAKLSIHLKHDEVELSDKYLSVIDDVEEQLEKTCKTAVCFEYWSKKIDLLAAHGIKWRSPSELNPNVLFD